MTQFCGSWLQWWRTGNPRSLRCGPWAHSSWRIGSRTGRSGRYRRLSGYNRIPTKCYSPTLSFDIASCLHHLHPRLPIVSVTTNIRKLKDKNATIANAKTFTASITVVVLLLCKQLVIFDLLPNENLMCRVFERVETQRHFAIFLLG